MSVCIENTEDTLNKKDFATHTLCNIGSACYTIKIKFLIESINWRKRKPFRCDIEWKIMILWNWPTECKTYAE